MKKNKNEILFWTGIIFAIWFAWTGMVWTYCACLVVSYPIGLISFYIWLKIKSDGEKRNKIIPITLIVGLILSISVLLWLLIFD